MKKAFVVIVCSLVGAGCATPEQNDAAQNEYRAPVYRTGSNIPRDREVRSDAQRELSPEERRMIEDMQNRSRQPIGVTK